MPLPTEWWPKTAPRVRERTRKAGGQQDRGPPAFRVQLQTDPLPGTLQMRSLWLHGTDLGLRCGDEGARDERRRNRGPGHCCPRHRSRRGRSHVRRRCADQGHERCECVNYAYASGRAHRGRARMASRRGASTRRPRGTMLNINVPDRPQALEVRWAPLDPCDTVRVSLADDENGGRQLEMRATPDPVARGHAAEITRERRAPTARWPSRLFSTTAACAPRVSRSTSEHACVNSSGSPSR